MHLVNVTRNNVPTRTIHVSIKINDALDQLKRGKNFFGGTSTQTMRMLTQAHAQGKKFISICDNLTEDGHCAGHETYD